MYKGQKVILKAYEKSDIEMAHKLFNNFEMQRFLSPSAIFPISFEEEAEFVASCGKNKDKTYSFAVTTLDGKYIGGCGYMNANWRNRTAWIGIAIADPEYWGKGYGTEAAQLLLDFIFNELNLRKVLLNVFSFNERAIKCYQKLGFKEEGRLKEQVYKDGKYTDDIIMAKFKEN